MQSIPWEQLVLVIYWLAGVCANWGVKCSQEKISPLQYWTTRPLYSAASLLISLAIVIHSLAVGDNEIMTYFGTGFVADALINRYVKEQPPEDKDVAVTQQGN